MNDGLRRSTLALIFVSLTFNPPLTGTSIYIVVGDGKIVYAADSNRRTISANGKEVIDKICKVVFKNQVLFLSAGFTGASLLPGDAKSEPYDVFAMFQNLDPKPGAKASLLSLAIEVDRVLQARREQLAAERKDSIIKLVTGEVVKGKATLYLCEFYFRGKEIVRECFEAGVGHFALPSNHTVATEFARLPVNKVIPQAARIVEDFVGREIAALASEGKSSVSGPPITVGELSEKGLQLLSPGSCVVQR